MRDDAGRTTAPDLKSALQSLVASFGAEAVKRAARRITAATTIRRPRGRPRGPALDDWPALKQAAADWRRTARDAAVYPSLINVAGALPGQRDSNAKRLLARLRARSWDELDRFYDERIGDFYAAACAGRYGRRDPFTTPGPQQEAAIFVIHQMALRSGIAVVDYTPRFRPALFVEDLVAISHGDSQNNALARYLVSLCRNTPEFRNRYSNLVFEL